MEIANALDDNSDKSQTLSSIASSLAQIGKIDEAAGVITKAIEIANAIKNSNNKFRDVSSTISHLVNSVNIHKIMSIVKEIEDNNNIQETLLKIILTKLEF